MKDEATLEDGELYINLNRKDIQDIIAIREPRIQEEILTFLDDVRQLYQTRAA